MRVSIDDLERCLWRFRSQTWLDERVALRLNNSALKVLPLLAVCGKVGLGYRFEVCLAARLTAFLTNSNCCGCVTQEHSRLVPIGGEKGRTESQSG
jgi:hypothetical protein